MAERDLNRSLTAGERLTALFFSFLPWLALAACTIPLPAYFLWRYFTVAEGAGEYMLFALTSLGAGVVVGLFAVLAAFAVRRVWEARLRERLARDGVTANELKWFLREVPAERRRALREMERSSPLLAEAYRDTLAANITASRVLAHARREADAVERRIISASQTAGASRVALERDLQKDRERAGRVLGEAIEHQHEVEARLQSIEAMASRDASEQETALALLHLGSIREQAPLGLADARAYSDARDEIEREQREGAKNEGEPPRLQSSSGGEQR